MRPLIHRMNNVGHPQCGAPLPAKVSTTGVMLTCPKCIELSRAPTREEALRQLEQAVARFRNA